MKPRELTTEQCNELLDRADKALANTYPESGKGYAVALLTKNGNIYEGVSYKSDTYTLTMHFRGYGISKRSHTRRERHVAITGPNCHICKQLIYESSLNSGIDVLVIIKEGDEIKQIPISELMPYPWPDKKVGTE